MRGPGPLSPLLRVVFSLLLACVLVLAVLGDATSAPRLNDPLAQRVGTTDGVLAQTIRLKAPRADPVPPPTDADPEITAFAGPAPVRGPDGTRRLARPIRTAPHGNLCQDRPPIRAPPRALQWTPQSNWPEPYASGPVLRAKMKALQWKTTVDIRS